MVNSQVVSEIVNAFKIDARVQNVPNPIPVIEVGCKSVKDTLIKYALRSTSGGATILTAPLDQDLYITGIEYHLIKDVTCDAADGVSAIYTSQGGISISLCGIPILTLTAQNNTSKIQNVLFKMDRGQALILATTNFAAGKMNRYITVTYYIDEVN